MMNFSAFFTYMVLTTFSPGPNNIMSLANANRFGLKNTMNFILGVTSGFLIIMLLCGYFNLLLFKYIPGIKGFIGIIGALYLTYLAYYVFTDKSDSSDTEEVKKAFTFRSGMTLQFINPKVIIYGITVQSVFIIPHYNTWFSLLFFSAVLAFAGFVSTSLWAYSGSIMQTFLKGHRRKFNTVMAVLLFYCAISVSGLL